MAKLDFAGIGRPMTEAGMAAALVAMDLDPVADLPVLWSVLTVESRGFGFQPDRRPKILFERHIFHRETGGRFAAQAPDLSASSGGGYIGGGAEYDRLGRALGLLKAAGVAPEPALRSASWGLGQVMGFNAVAAGFASAADLAARMAEGEDAQLLGMARFIAANRLHRHLAARNWAAFARGYNGSEYWKNAYDVKLKAAFDRFSSGVGRDLRARTAQAALVYLGYAPGEPDGVVGQNTRNAVAAFRKAEGMPKGDALDTATYAALMAKAGLQQALPVPA
jgi:hypothetical protein